VVHGGGSSLYEVKQIRRCRALIVGVAAARPWLRGGVPTQWPWPVTEDTGDVGAEGRRGGYGEGGNGENVTANSISSRCTNLTETNQRTAFAVHRTVMARMYPHVKRRLCTPIEQTVRKKPRTQIYANKGSMTTTRKQNLRAGMGRTRAGWCRACSHDGHARA